MKIERRYEAEVDGRRGVIVRVAGRRSELEVGSFGARYENMIAIVALATEAAGAGYALENTGPMVSEAGLTIRALFFREAK